MHLFFLAISPIFGIFQNIKNYRFTTHRPWPEELLYNTGKLNWHLICGNGLLKHIVWQHLSSLFLKRILKQFDQCFCSYYIFPGFPPPYLFPYFKCYTMMLMQLRVYNLIARLKLLHSKEPFMLLLSNSSFILERWNSWHAEIQWMV